MVPERHSALLRPELSDNLNDKSVNFSERYLLPRLVDDDTSSGEEEGDTLVRHVADSPFEDRGEGKASATAIVRPVHTLTEHRVRSGSTGSTLSGSSSGHPSRPPLAPLSVDTASELQRVERAPPTHLDVQTPRLHEPVTGSVLHNTLNYYGTIPVAHRTAVGTWNTIARSICSMLHAADIRGRWEAKVHARLRKWKKQCKSKAKQERWYVYQRKCQREQDDHMAEMHAITANTEKCQT